MVMSKEEIKRILEDHAKWLKAEGGKKADLSMADLSRADLSRADLRWADLRLADLRWAKLGGADLSVAKLGGADLSRADLSGAKLDFSSWPLWCGSLDVVLCDKLKAQLMYHVVNAVGSDKFTQDQITFANTFNRVESGDCEKC